MRHLDVLPAAESMKARHRVRKFRRSNAEHGNEKRWHTTHNKPWKTHNPARSAA